MGGGRVAPSVATKGSGLRSAGGTSEKAASGSTAAASAGKAPDAKGSGGARPAVPPGPPTSSARGSAPTPSSPAAARPKGAAEAAPQRISTGVRRLDQLLGGGIRVGSFLLFYGPPFIGKELLAQRTLVTGMRAGMPAIYLGTGTTADECRERLQRLDPALSDLEKGLLHYVDTYSSAIDAQNDAPNVHYVDGPMDLNGISLAVNEAQRAIASKHDHHLLVVDSLSTIVAYGNAQTAFRFLQVLLGKARRAGATTLVLLDEGMHTDAEVQMFKHLMTGSIDLRENAGKYQLRTLGLSEIEGLGWVDYHFQGDKFDVTGSFAAGRIR